MDRTLSGANTLGQYRLGSDSNEWVFRIPQISSIAGASPSDCLMSYPGHSLVGSNHSAEMQLVYSTAPAPALVDWANLILRLQLLIYGSCGASLHCHYYQVHSDPEYKHLREYMSTQHLHTSRMWYKVNF